MAKKARKKTTSVQDVPPLTSLFDQRFPTIARWISQEEGWVELGADHYSRSLVRALYGGGMVWEGKDDYKSLDEALRAMEEGIAAWLEEHRPASGTRGEADRATGGSRRRAGKKAGDRARSTSPERAQTRQPSSPKDTAGTEGNELPKRDATPSVPRSVIEKVRKFVDIAEGLRREQRFEITRLTTIKGLCKEPRAAWRFALFLAVNASKKVALGRCPERDKALAAQTVTAMEAYIEEPSPERGTRLRSLLRDVEAEQNETRRVGWNQVRMVRNRDLLVIENALRSIIFIVEAPVWLYQAARDYAERYNPRYGTGLIPDSAPMVQEIADFWRDYYGLDR
jgi:hypothetical protein